MDRGFDDPNAQDDAALVARVRGGERAVYRVLVDRHAPMVFGVVRRFVRDAPDVEDQAQEIFVKAFESLERFAPGTSFGAWLYTLASNHCRDWARNVRRRTQPMSRVEPALWRGALVDAALPSDAVDRHERASLLRGALASLRSDYVTPFLMRYDQGMAYADMAQALGVSPGALKVRVHRARAELRNTLRDLL